MNEQLPDNTVIIVIIVTLIIVFTLIFSVKPDQRKLQPSIEWKNTPSSSPQSLQI